VTRAQAIGTIRDVDTDLITALQRRNAVLERGLQRVAEALGLPQDAGLNAVIVRIQELV
jgi:hypothetical protein